MRIDLVAAAIGAALTLSACAPQARGPANAPGEVPAVVSVTPAHPASLPRRIELTGTLTAQDSAVVGAEQPGRVAALMVREGDPVVGQQPLAVIDAATYTAAVEDATGSAAAARAGVQAASSDTRVFEAAVAAARASMARGQAEVVAASAAARNARARAGRFDGLYREGAVSRQDLDDAEAAADQAAAALAAAEAAERSARSDLARAEAALETASANTDVATSQARAAHARQAQATAVLGQTIVRAPFSGMITKRWLDAGAYASAGTPVVTVQSTQRLELDLSVPEPDVQSVPAGGALGVSVDALGGVTVPGRVRALIPGGVPENHTFIAKVSIDDHRGLLPGMFARVWIAGRPITGTGVPATAVVQRAEQSGVFLIAGGRARFQPVSVRWTDGRTTLVDGLADSAPVAVGAGLLVDGERVVVR